MIRWPAVILIAALPACVVHYSVSTGTDSNNSTGISSRCPEGQVECDDGCAAPDACEACPDGQIRCDEQCVAWATCDDPTDSGEPCSDDQVLCGEQCTAPEDCPCAPGCDPALEQCVGDDCLCRPGLSRCGEVCVDLRTDPQHCGDCERTCDEVVCQDGECQEDCFADHTECEGACVLTSEDSLHCGDCATLCGSDEVCLAGICRAYSPAEGCEVCPCPAVCDEGDGAQTCCASIFLDAPVCVDGTCDGDQG